MLFGSQYDDEGGTDHSGSPTTPPQSTRKKKSAPSSARKGLKTNRRDKSRPSMAGAASAVLAAGQSSPTQSFDSTNSSSGASMSYLLTNQRNNSNNNLNYTTFDTVNGSAAGTVPKTRRRSKKKGERIKKLKRPVDRQCMYPSVWKQLQFRKKIVQLATNLSEKPICVTGVDGFLASWIVCELLNRGYHVRGTVQNGKDDISGLLQLPNASKNFSVVETSLLTPEACDMAVQGCDFVIHTGTPSSCSVRDPLSEQQEPGVHSIGSRMHCIIPMMTNFIQACARARIKRVVLTSSIAAMADSVTPESIINDACWNVTSSLEKNPHFLSLKLAEEAAWQL
ncbi:Dihydroflavonol-4-reductase, partial [Phytophthora palmivora]